MSDVVDELRQYVKETIDKLNSHCCVSVKDIRTMCMYKMIIASVDLGLTDSDTLAKNQFWSDAILMLPFSGWVNKFMFSEQYLLVRKALNDIAMHDDAGISTETRRNAAEVFESTIRQHDPEVVKLVNFDFSILKEKCEKDVQAIWLFAVDICDVIYISGLNETPNIQ